MAFTADTGESKVARSDYYAVDPRALVIDWRKNIGGGCVEPAVDEDLERLARSMLPTTLGGQGQIAPIRVRPLPDRRLEVIMGFRRTRAALWLIEQGICTDFKLSYIVSRLSDEDAALSNFVENIERRELSPLQKAHTIRALEESYFFSTEQIAAKLGRSVTWVSQTRDMVMLPSPIQAAVANGELSSSAAKEFLSMPAPEAVETFRAARDSGEKVTATAIKDAKRAKQEAAKAAAAEANGDGEHADTDSTTSTEPKTKAVSDRPIPRSLKHLKTFLSGVSGTAEHKEGKRLAEMIEDWLAGDKTDEQLNRCWYRIFPAPKVTE